MLLSLSLCPACLLRCTLALTCLLLPGATFAQKTDTLADQALHTVIIQTTRADAKNPVPHTNFSSEKISRQYHAQDVPYLLSRVPSLVESSDAGAGVGYTGLRIRGSDPTRVNITINGIPLNDAESQGVFWVNLPDLAASAAEIQVQRGVGTSTNGAGAFGATVNVDLSKVSPEPFATLSACIGAFGVQKQSAYVGTGLLKNRFSISTRVSRILSDGYIDRASADLHSLHLTGTYIDHQQSLQAHLLSGKERTYQAWYGLPAQYLDVPAWRTFNPAGTERPGSPYPNEVDDYTQRHLMLHYKRLLGNHLQAQINGHYTRGFGYYEQYKADQEAADYGLLNWSTDDSSAVLNDLVRQRWLDNHFYGTSLALRWMPSGRCSPNFLLGGALSRYQGQHFGKITWAERAEVVRDDFRYYDNKATKRDANLFLKTELAPGKGWLLFTDLQVRGVHYSFLGFDNFLQPVEQEARLLFFNPKLGVSWQFYPQWTAYAFGGIAHREPNRDDYTQSTPFSRPLPERLLNVEAGFRKQAPRWSAALNGYWMYYHNQLVLNGAINDVGAYIRTNVPQSSRMGVEMEGAATVHPRLTTSGNLSLSHNRVRFFDEYIDVWDDGSQRLVQHRNTDLAFSPAVVGSLEITGVLWSKKGASLSALQPAVRSQELMATLSGKYISRQFLDNTSNTEAQLPAYSFSDFRLNYDWYLRQGQKLSVLVSVLNWLDARYSANGWVYRYISAGYDARPDNAYTRSEGGDVYYQAGFFPQAGRHWMATLRMEF